MIGSAFIGSLLSVILGTLVGCCIPKNWYPYMDLVYSLSTHLTIYTKEKKRVSHGKAKDEKWSLWDYYSLARNYFLIVLLRGFVFQVVEVISEGRWERYEFQRAIHTVGPFIGVGIMCLVVIIAFENVINTIIAKDIITCLALLTRATRSIQIFKRQKHPKAYYALTEMTKQNVLNGASTTIAMTIIDLIFFGDITILAQWIGIRSFFFVMPILHTYFKTFGLHRAHAQVIKQIQDMARVHKAAIAEKLGDGLLMMTLFTYLMASFIVAPTIRGLIKLASSKRIN